MSDWQVIHGDCLEVLPTLKAGSVDAVITDPPYGTTDGRGKVVKRGGELVEFAPGDWDIRLPLAWVDIALRALCEGRWIGVFTDNLSVKTLWDAIEESGGRGKQTFYWFKVNPPPQPRGNFASSVETAVMATKGAVKKWNGGGWARNYIQAPLVTGPSRTEHPTQKPVAVMQYLISLTTDEGDTVLDPFMGSGTTGVACVKTGRNFIGIEIDEDYCDIARQRIEEAAMQPRLV